ncbi:hypothetical protein [Alkaliphilus serpentinus]|uniref:Uncharacterized protein n=1 Tax=Alkaliphilus serpentinus TaxID=1482731 RepID=A0A833HM09_9FIRM|nr:hypothetical protein [Alkaliphilus serpentinus]KAB3527100.1 hypothetical protein F8153_13065 [Alkaliphilus serpentinus]
MKKEIYSKIREYTYNDKLIALDGLLECSNFENLGIYIFEIIKNECLIDVAYEEEILKRVLLHPKKMEDFSNENFYEVLAKEICDFEVLPSITLDEGKNVITEITAEVELLRQRYEERNTMINHRIEELTDEIDEVKNRISNDTNILKPLKQFEDEKSVLLNEKRLLELELQQRQHVYVYFQASFNDLLDPGIQKRELYQNSVRASRKNKSSEISDIYNYYLIDVDVFKGLFEQYDNVFYKSKLYYLYDKIQKKYYYELSRNKEQTNILEMLQGEVNSFPKIHELRNLRSNDLEKYKRILKDLIEQYEVINVIEDGIENNYCLIERKPFLLKCLQFYKEKDYVVFNNVVASQIEGMFNDFMRDITTYLRIDSFRELDFPILRKVLEFLNDVGKGIHLEIYLYFFYYFVDQVRNPIAHGDYAKCINEIDDETLAVELILDMASIIYIIENFSESSRIKNFFSGFFKVFFYKDNTDDYEFYDCIINELLGERMHAGFQKLEYMNAIEVLYWLFNPYYEDRIEFYHLTDEVNRFKRIVCSEAFWLYVNENLDKVLDDEFCQFKFSSDFKFVICRMFSIARNQNNSIIPMLVEAKKKLDEIF